jgi:hypothetical protein
MKSEPIIIEHKDENKLSVKEKILYTLLGVGGVIGLTWWGTRKIKKGVENKAEAKSFQDGTPETYAKELKMAFENDGWPGTNVKALRTTLTSIKSKAEMKKVFDAYTREYHKNLYKDMSDELQQSEYNEMLQIVNAKPDQNGQKIIVGSAQYDGWAKRLKAAFDKTYGFIPGTDEAAIKQVFIEIPTQTAFINVGKAYYKLYNANLITDLKSELELWEYGDYMKIITTKPKK